MSSICEVDRKKAVCVRKILIHTWTSSKLESDYVT